MNQSIRRIQHFCKHGEGSFSGSLKCQHAVLWNLQLISLAGKHLGNSFRDAHPQVDWDHLDHLCREVIGDPWQPERDSIWECVHAELPELHHGIQSIINERQIK